MIEHPSTSAGTLRAEAGPIPKALAGLAALAVAMGIGRFAFTPILPMMLQDAGLSIASGGWLASANYLGYLLGALSAMVVKIRPERAIRGGLLAIAAVTLAMGWPLPFAVWLVLRLLAGFASAWVLISVSAWCMESLVRYQRPFLNSLVFAGVGTGIATAGLMCLVLIGMDAHSPQAWRAMGLLSLAVTLLVWRFFRTSSTVAAVKAGQGRFPWAADAVR
ncbi:YbfB/YjiJ family MFS transporter, partial [Noviherbaspirillum denitrificans]|uniref:YbfB/YjiJ family MFS transporter n=1 Tax=Noviherbaspirillum denitrificans TaxID=1968433 RepID=UPI00198110CA